MRAKINNGLGQGEVFLQIHENTKIYNFYIKRYQFALGSGGSEALLVHVRLFETGLYAKAWTNLNAMGDVSGGWKKKVVNNTKLDEEALLPVCSHL